MLYMTCDDCRSMTLTMKDCWTPQSIKSSIEQTWYGGVRTNATRTTAISVGWSPPDQVPISRYGLSAMPGDVLTSGISRKIIDVMCSKFVLWQRKRQDSCEAGFSHQASLSLWLSGAELLTYLLTYLKERFLCCIHAVQTLTAVQLKSHL